MATAEETRAANYRAQCVTRTAFQEALAALRAGSPAAYRALLSRTQAVGGVYDIQVCESAIEDEQTNEQVP